MRIKDCPDCSSGWRYACDLPDGGHRHREGLVTCPTCHGTGRIVIAEDQAKARHVRASQAQHAPNARSTRALLSPA